MVFYPTGCLGWDLVLNRVFSEYENFFNYFDKCNKAQNRLNRKKISELLTKINKSIKSKERQ